MNEGFKIPPYNKSALTPPSVIAKRLSALVGVEFKLTRKTRTDGANARKLIAATLEKYPLPAPAEADTYSIIPPKRKGIPRILREYIDTYIVTTGDSYNLQVWNRNPASDSVQIEYVHGDTLSAKDVRFVFVRIDPGADSIRTIIVLTPEYIEARFGRFGKPTIKYQLLIPNRARKNIVGADPPLLFSSDTTRISTIVLREFHIPTSAMHDQPGDSDLFSLEVIRDKVANRLLGIIIDPGATKTRGQELEFKVAQLLGYTVTEDYWLAGGYPDIRNQLLEVKVQDSPTVDLGLYSPQFEEEVTSSPFATTSDIRYLIALTDSQTGIVQGLILCPGAKLGEHFSYVADTSFKCQRSIPMSFFDQYDGKAIFNP